MKKLPFIITLLLAVAAIVWLLLRNANAPPEKADAKALSTASAASGIKRGAKSSSPVRRNEGGDLRAKPLLPNGAGSGRSRLERWTAVARETYFRVLNPETLKLSGAVVNLLDLSPEQEAALGEVTDDLLQKVKEGERARAYVEVSPNGDEQIVVPAASHKKLIGGFKGRVRELLGNDAAEFMESRIYRDSSFSVLEHPVVMSIEIPSEGIPLLTVKRTVMDSRAADPDTPFIKDGISLSPVSQTTSTGPFSSVEKGCYSHLWDAATVLPRRDAVPDAAQR